MDQVAKHTFSKMNQDLAKSKYSPDVYYEGKNIRIITNEGFGGVTNEDGNELKLTLPSIDNNPSSTKSHLNNLSYPLTDGIILGHTTINKDLYLLVKYTLDNAFAIYKVDKNYTITLLFLDTLNVETTKIDVVGFYESQSIQKLYWVDGTNELRFANVADPTLMELNKKFLSTVPSVILTQPTITGFTTGGSHTSGTIQYAYNLYKTNGAQSKISSLSSIAFLNNSDRGNDVSIQVDKAIQFEINNIDTSFNRIRIYSIKYSSLNSLPKITLISEQDVTNSTLNFIDDNNTLLSELTFAEFIALGGETYYPKHLKIKDNHLFLFNYKTKSYDIDFDARAYRFASDGSLLLNGDTNITSTGFIIPEVPLTHDAINPSNKAIEAELNFNKYIWKSATGTTPDDYVRAPYFDELFTFIGTFNFYEQNYYDANNEQVILSTDPSIVYSNNRNLVYTTFALDPSLTFLSASIDGGGDFIESSLCASATPNYPGDRQWQVTNLGAGQIRLLVQYTTDSRCPLDKETKGVEILVSDGVTTHTLSFKMVQPGVDDPDARILISQFDAGTYTIEVSNPPISDGVLGGVGNNVEYEIKYKTIPSNYGEATLLSTPNLATVDNPIKYTGLKSGEVYRLFLQFLLEDGSFSFNKWVGDVKIPEIGSEKSLPHVDGNGNISYPFIETKLKTLPNDSRVVGWRTTIVERTEYDKSVVTQGIYDSTIEDNVNPNIDVLPSYVQRTITNDTTGPTIGSDINKVIKINSSTISERNLSTNLDGDREITGNNGDYRLSNEIALMYSPESTLGKKIPITSGRIRRIGLIKNTYSQSFREVYDDTNTLVDEIDYLINENDISKEVLEEGARLLTNFKANVNNTNSVSGRQNCKLISSGKNKEDDDAVIYSRKRLAFTRYFGGLSYTTLNTAGLHSAPIDNNIGFTTPILNVFNIPIDFGASFKRLAGQGNIVLKYPEDEVTGEIFKYYSGSATVISGGAANVISTGSELNPADLNDYGILIELYRIIPNQYGGDTYEAKQLNKTIPYSNVVGMQINTPTTEHQGDTYIQKFNFLKTFRADNGTTQISEIVSIPVETTINLDLRWDLLKNRPDNYEADENTSYGFNLVYSQSNNTIRGLNKPFNFQEINDFPVNVIPSKKKFNNELIDNFTDFLINDTKSLDGQYGEITGVGEYKDSLFAFQRTATAYLSINPRVQLPTGDNIPIELGSGALIERYQYLTTNSGTLNKWSIVKSTNGLMYVDLLTKSINFINADPMKITTLNGFYNKFLNYITTNEDTLLVDNPVLGNGIVTFYDKIKEDTYITFLGDTNLTISYNGLAQGFVSFYDYFPKHYINVDNKVLTVNDLDKLWEHNKIANKNTFYGNYFPSEVTLVVNQNPDVNKVFNNIHFNSEFTINGVDKSDITFTKLRIWNDFQDTTESLLDTLNYRTTIKRRLRKWNLIVPRDTITSRDRISNYWTYIKLKFDKQDLPLEKQLDYDFILQDLLVSFTMKP